VSNSTVSQIGGNTYVVSTGESNYLWNDKNNNGQVDDGDLFARTRQSDASVTTYIVGKDEGLFAWGDPHLDNLAFSAEGKAAVIGSVKSVFEDAKDGKLDNQSLLGNIDQALGSHGTRDNIMDFHANIAIGLTDNTRVEFDVARQGNVAYTENVDLDVVDAQGNKRTVTFTEIWSGNGGAGQSRALDSTNNNALQAVKDPNELRLFHEYKGANVMHSTMMFGTDAGTKDYAYVIDANGELNLAHGKMTMESIRFYDCLVRGNDLMLQAMQLGGYKEDEYEEQAQAAQATARSGGAAKTGITA
jgi:hypothetical protein